MVIGFFKILLEFSKKIEKMLPLRILKISEILTVKVKVKLRFLVKSAAIAEVAKC